MLTKRALGVVLQRDSPDGDVVGDEDVDAADEEASTSTRGRWAAGYSRNCMDKVDTGRVTETSTDQPSVWKVAPQWPPPAMEPKLAMLFFIKEKIFNADLWVAWLEQAESHNVPFHLAIHTKSPNITLDARLHKYLHKEHIENDKCNLWNAQWALINPVLENKKFNDVSHFMMLSENAVPVKALHQIYAELRRQPLSRFCVDDNFVRPRAETWWVIRRDDMAWFYNNTEVLHKWFGKGCIDENLWYGALKECRRQDPGNCPILDQCWMYVNWRLRADGGCKDWKRVAENTHTPILDQQPHQNTTSGHPVTWLNATADAFNELYHSPHWFARKFTDGAVPLEVASRMLTAE